MAKDSFKEGFNKGYREGVQKILVEVAEKAIKEAQKEINVLADGCLKDGDVITICGGKITFVMKDGKFVI